MSPSQFEVGLDGSMGFFSPLEAQSFEEYANR